MKRTTLTIIAALTLCGAAVAQETEPQRLAREIEERATRLRELLVTPIPDPDPDPGTGVVDFPIVAVRHVRPDDETPTVWPGAKAFAASQPGQELVLVKADGTVEVLVTADDGEAICDPAVRIDGKAVYFSKSFGNVAEGDLTHADIFVMDMATRVVTQITTQGSEPRINTGPCSLVSGRICYTSAIARAKFAGVIEVPQLWVIDEDGTNNEKTGFLNLAGALHPVPMPDGRIAWSSDERFGLRGGPWGIWASNPDGTEWGPLASAFTNKNGIGQIFHFHTPLPGGEFAFADYYQAANFGSGAVHKFRLDGGFGSPDERKNSGGFPFQPGGESFETILPGVSPDRNAAMGGPEWNDTWVGKFTHPMAAPGGMLATWSGPSPANTKKQPMSPAPTGTIIFVPDAGKVSGLDDFKIVTQDAGYNYLQPQPLVPFAKTFGADPVAKAWLPQNRNQYMPLGTPYGIAGTDSCYTRESKVEGNWQSLVAVGGDVVEYEDKDIEYVRILVQELDHVKPAYSYDSAGAKNPERVKILADIPLRKFDADGKPILDSNGDPDTSFWFKTQSNMAWTFALLDEHKQNLSVAMTWHQLRPGEVRTDCKGCHAHHEASQVAFDTTEAFKLAPVDLTKTKPVGFDYANDVKPIIQKHCATCHDGSNPDAMDLDGHMRSYLNRRYWQTQPAVPFNSRESRIIQRLRLPVDDPNHMPQGGPMLSDAEIETIAKWIDTGCQSDNGNVDSTLPTLHIETPRRRNEPISEIRFGAADLYGIKSISVQTSWLQGEQIGNFTETDGVYVMPLESPVASGSVTISVMDNGGNTTTQTRTFKE